MNLFLTYAEEQLVRALAPLVPAAFKELLETKHLYQSVDISAEAIAGVAKTIRGQNRMTGFGTTSSANSEANFNYTGEQVLSYPWSPDLEEKQSFEAAIALMTGQKKEKPKCITFGVPATIRTYCDTCHGKWPFNPVRTLGKTEPGSLRTTDQWFFLVYQCQSCKGEPVRFLIRRKGLKLRLCGRDPFEEVVVPDVLPKPHRVHFSSALVAYQAGQQLAGVFFLRVFIEQYWKSVPEISKDLSDNPRLTGDEMGAIYAKSLPTDFRDRFPSLADIYGRLSSSIHLASVHAGDFDKAAAEIVRHFEARRLFNLP
jgi:hypothetical protein